MSESSKIAWTDSTFNPWRICTPIGPGCDGCYAAAMGRRFGLEYKQGVPRIRTGEAYWKQPLTWNRKAAKSGEPWRVFCASLADVFDNEAPDEWRTDLWKLINATPHLSWLLVTKRIGNVAKMLPRFDGGFVYVPDNVRILITVVNQEEADRDIPKLLALPCKNGISYEPALGPVDWREWMSVKTLGFFPRHVEWIIVGGESDQAGSKARPFAVDWARSTIWQCRAAGVPVFIKQIGSNPFESGFPHLRLVEDRAGADPAEWVDDLRVREFPNA